MDFQVAREKIGVKFQGVTDVSEGIYRGVRKRNQLEFAAYVFDVTNSLPHTEGELSKYLDRVVGHSYFDERNASDLRWNNYLYFVVNGDVKNSDGFNIKKRAIEANRSYARKFIISEEDFDEVLAELDSVATSTRQIQVGNVLETWTEKLDLLGLSEVISTDRPISEIVKTVSGGQTRTTSRSKRDTGLLTASALVSSHLSALNLQKFGRNLASVDFDDLGRVNLLFGANGVGKTSFMEGLEFLFCGQNRRSKLAQDITVEARLKSGEVVVTSSVQDSNDFRTRQRRWYGTNDKGNENFLKNQFARFNFLNTDAAAELSLLSGIQRRGIKSDAESLADLLSGHEVTEVWKRINQVNRDIIEELRVQKLTAETIRANLKVVEEQISSATDAPVESDAAFSILEEELNKLGWKKSPKSIDDLKEGDVDDLVRVAGNLGIIRQLEWMQSSVTQTAIRDEYERLTPISKVIDELLDDERANYEMAKLLVVEYAGAHNRVQEIDKIDLKSADELVNLRNSLAENEKAFAEDSLAFSRLPRGDLKTLSISTFNSLSIKQAIAEVEEQCNHHQLSLAEFQGSLDTLSKTKSRLQQEISRLFEAASFVLEHQHSDDQCPLCRTNFAYGELAERMRLDVTFFGEEDLRATAQKVEAERESFNNAVERLELLNSLRSFCLAREVDTSKVTVTQTVEEANRLSVKRTKLLAENFDINTVLASLGELGVTVERLTELCLPIDGRILDESQQLDLRAARLRAQKMSEDIEKELSELDEISALKRKQIQKHFESAGLTTNSPANGLAGNLKERITLLILAMASIEEVFSEIAISQDSDLKMTLATISSAVLSAKNTISLFERDKKYMDAISDLLRDRSNHEASLDGVEQAIQRLKIARDGLEPIIARDSLENSTAAVIKATHKVAGTVFNRIHIPAEYRIADDAAAPLVRRDDNKPVTLNEISTGQRAAYALSMFLAMNAMVTNGPKVIMLDDPISQVDDLNALSFLDYLRNLVLSSDRQIFFATADAKIAGLFMHKFAFLGDEFKLLELGR
ncbi:hypothetical protein [Herbaspirillum sp. alder98]|uniref:hypothetical protein n=1 Tax=Herbaspirillum sp. alder98 TaxID=2913096 RepID=UPI001CD867E9|nr:hypothetical protein [Herbaspirillum sp. alder98]